MFSKDGFANIPQVLAPTECDTVVAKLDRALPEANGLRSLLLQSWCQHLATQIRQQPALAALLPTGHVAVQCTYFEKSSENNWLVPIHQDLSIPVAQRVDHPSLKGWSEKEGTLYVQPPIDVLQQLVAVRVHLDNCGPDDGALRVVPGSHLRGILTSQEAVAMRQEGTEVVCAAPRGSALVMRPLLLHASSKSTGHSRRRVLHYLFGPPVLPMGLRWQHQMQ